MCFVFVMDLLGCFVDFFFVDPVFMDELIYDTHVVKFDLSLLVSLFVIIF